MRVKLIGLPGLARDIIAATIDAEPDMAVIAAAAGSDEFVDRADVVVVDERASLYDTVCRSGARLAVVAVDAECRTAVVCMLDPGRSLIRDMSAAALVRVLRELVRSP